MCPATELGDSATPPTFEGRTFASRVTVDEVPSTHLMSAQVATSFEYLVDAQGEEGGIHYQDEDAVISIA